jgi:hypothetical protein
MASAMVMLWPFGMSWTAPVDHLIGEPNDAVAVKGWDGEGSRLVLFKVPLRWNSPRTARAN